MAVLEEQRCEKAHQRAHHPRGQAGDGGNQEHLLVLAGGEPTHSDAHGRGADQKGIQQEADDAHDGQLAEGSGEDEILHPAHIQCDIVADHSVDHDADHHDGVDDFLFLCLRHCNYSSYICYFLQNKNSRRVSLNSLRRPAAVVSLRWKVKSVYCKSCAHVILLHKFLHFV